MSSESPARNGLAGEQSPFLQHGATQPVDWSPWGKDAFERARAADRPVLLDIGAVWCHWCHVMDRESYEDPATAALINELFVPVKVDRDERPDVDARYQRAVQLLTGQGGWPLTAFLTPEGEVFYGGTYFPPADAYGRPSFQRVLREVFRVWRDERTRALEAAAQIGERLTHAGAAEARPGEPSPAVIGATIEELARSFDFRHGGFGAAPKFPHAGGLELMLDEYLDRDTSWARRIVQETLHAMVRGGFYDQLGGGFHRYSTDARWIIPHFEKMSYDNGVLLAVCARAAVALADEEIAAAARDVVAHYHDIAPDLLAAGGFPASQDADYSPDDDGDYWTWTHAEIEAVLGADDARIAGRYYGLDDSGSAMHLDPERHVLFRARSVAALARELDLDEHTAAQRIADIRVRLKAARDERPAPYLDRTLYAGWVALVAAGFLAAARHLTDAAARETAVRALERVWTDGFRADAGMLHRLGDDSSGAHLDDQAHVLLALVDAFEVTQSPHWLERAAELAAVLRRRFTDAGTGALRDRPLDDAGAVPTLDRPYLPIHDSPTPSGNGAGALALLRLHAYTHDDTHAAAAAAILRAFAGSAARIGSSAATYVHALAWLLLPRTTVVVVEQDGGPLWAEALRSPRPRTVLRRFPPGSVEPSALPPELAAMVTGAAPRAYVCAGHVCAAPADTATALAGTLRTFRPAT